MFTLPISPAVDSPIPSGTSEGRTKTKCTGKVYGLWSQTPGERTPLSLDSASLTWGSHFITVSLFPQHTASIPWAVLSLLHCPAPGQRRRVVT